MLQRPRTRACETAVKDEAFPRGAPVAAAHLPLQAAAGRLDHQIHPRLACSTACHPRMSRPIIPANMCRLLELVSDLQRRLAVGDKVYLHCWGGRGRAGTVGACLLAQMYG